jgi:hypothetical protein
MSPSKRPIPTHHLRNSRDEQPCRQRDSNSLIQQSNYGRTTLGAVRPPECVLSAFTFHRLTSVQSTSRYKVFSTCDNVDLDLVLETEPRRQTENVSIDMGFESNFVNSFCCFVMWTKWKDWGFVRGRTRKKERTYCHQLCHFFFFIHVVPYRHSHVSPCLSTTLSTTVYR